MAADPLLYPDNQAAYLRNLEDRVRRLEATNRMLSSSIKEGALTVLDSSNGRQAMVGLLDDGSYGVAVGPDRPVPTLKSDSINGMSYPELPVEFIPTRSTFVTWGRPLTELTNWSTHAMSHAGIYVRFRASTDVGTTGAVQLARSGGVYSSEIAIPSDSFLTTFEFWWLHQGSLGSSYTITMTVARTSGAGSCLVEDPNSAALIGPKHCSTSGAYVP